MVKIRYAVLLVAVMLALVAGSSWGQDGPEPLFEPALAPADARPIQGDGGQQRRYVTVNTALLQAPAGAGPAAGSALELELFDGVRKVALADSITRAASGAIVWQGQIQNQPEETVTLAAQDSVAAGSIRADGHLYRLTYAGDGVHLLEELPLVEPTAEHLPIPIDRPTAAGAEGGQMVSADDGSTVDVLVVYTPASRARYGGQAGIETLINVAVSETNTAYQNSLINTRLSLVATAEIGYSESGSMLDDLYRLQRKSDGHMDQVHAWRDTVAADTVTLIQEASDYCGIAYLMTSLSHSFESYAFSVVDSDCATGYYSFGHELGHNMGSTHDHANGNSALYPYSYGYWAPKPASGYLFRTIMAYNCTGGCPRIQHFSNPNVYYGGQPTGVAYNNNPGTAADNARSLNQASYTVANWRDSATRRPAAPTGLVATAQSPTRIDLTWQDKATGETGFELQRRIAGQSWAAIAYLIPDSTSYQDQGLAADTMYEYRIRSYDEGDVSDFSNVAGATTPRWPELHVGELYGGGSVESGFGPASFVWRATVSIRVHDAYHEPVSGATVSGQWSGGASGSASCLTDGSGACNVVKSGLAPGTASVSLSVSGISKGSDPYLPDHNHDPGGNGTAITVYKPQGTFFLPRINRGS